MPVTSRFHTQPGSKYFCVVGSPIAHSKSPLIHRLFADQLGIALRYEKVEVPRGALAEALVEFRLAGGTGINVTVPLKDEAYGAAEVRQPRAAAAGAANTLWIGDDGRLIADNTDGIGLVRDLLQNAGFGIRDSRILLIGAGGAARGILPALLAAQPRELDLTNRTLARAEALVARASGLASLAVRALEAPSPAPYDLVINATSAGLSGEVPALHPTVLSPETWCYDLVYGAKETDFLAWCRARGARRRRDGLGMLVEQAAESFALWHGVMPETSVVISALGKA